jgi:eukaryotic-like serine/threonine-protein kinase
MAILPLPRKCLGPYEILSTINGGGMGKVYRARSTRLNRYVFLSRGSGTHFEREAPVLGALNHPPIVAIYGLTLAAVINNRTAD